MVIRRGPQHPVAVKDDGVGVKDRPGTGRDVSYRFRGLHSIRLPPDTTPWGAVLNCIIYSRATLSKFCFQYDDDELL